LASDEIKTAPKIGSTSLDLGSTIRALVSETGHPTATIETAAVRVRRFLRKLAWRLTIKLDIRLRGVAKRLANADLWLLGIFTLGIVEAVIWQRRAIATLPAAVFDALLTSAGVMLGAILAITLSFRLFAVQVATDRNAASLQPMFVKDRLNVITVALQSSLVLLVFAFVILARIRPSLTTVSVIVAVTSIGLSLLLLRIQFVHNALLANPLTQIERLRRRGQAYLRRMARYSEGIAAAGLVHGNLEEDKGRDADEISRLHRTKVFLNYGPFLGESAFRQAIYLIDTFTARAAQRNDYDVVARGLDASATLIVEYFQVRHDTLLPVPSGLLTFATVGDEVLTEFLERHRAIALQSVRGHDEGLCRSMLAALGLVGAGACQLTIPSLQYDIPPLWRIHASLMDITRSALRDGLADAGLQAIEVAGRIGAICGFRGLAALTVQFGEDLAAIGGDGLGKRDTPLTGPALGGLSRMIQSICRSGNFEEITVDSLLRYAADLTDFAVALIPARASLSLGFATGEMWDVTKPTALARIHAEFAARTLQTTDDRARRRVQADFIGFNKALAYFFNRIGRPPQTRESFLALFLWQEVGQIVFTLLTLADKEPWRDRRPDLLRYATLDLRSLWQAYDKVGNIESRHPVEFASLIIGTCFRLVTLGVTADCKTLVAYVSALGEACAQRGTPDAKRYTLDIAADLALLGAFAVERGSGNLAKLVEEVSLGLLHSYQTVTAEAVADIALDYERRVEGLVEYGGITIDDAVQVALAQIEPRSARLFAAELSARYLNDDHDAQS
jgi:hypothetical protein